MMKLLVLSDTHGSLAKAARVLEKHRDIDMILHCGDYQRDAALLPETVALGDLPVISVKGNCDECYEREYRLVDTPAGKILLTHGHMEKVHLSQWNNLLLLAEEQQCAAVCFGHTHRPMCQDFDGIWLVNPGSLTEPRDGTNGSFAILTCSETGIQPEIIYYDPAVYGSTTPPAKKKKVKGGYLRDLLNYSDRF